MARWGIEIRNTAGAVQIDDRFADLAFIAKGSVTTGAATSYGASSSAQRSSATLSIVSVEMPVLAIACAFPATLEFVSHNAGTNTWTFTFYAEGGSRTITWYRFDLPPAVGTAGWGVRVISGGSIKYDSRHRYARIAGRVAGTYTPGSVGAAGPSLSLTAGRTYAILLGQKTGNNAQAVVNTGANSYQINNSSYRLAPYISGASLGSRLLLVSAGSGNYTVPPAPPPPQSWEFANWNYSWAALDVTGY